MEKKRDILILAAGAAVLLLASAAAVLFGGDFVIWPGTAGWELRDTLANFRLHRVLTALVVGGALAVSGTAYQAVLRNPLAEPYILGVSGGAGLGAALAMFFGWNLIWIGSLPLAALVGALAALGLVWCIASGGVRSDFSTRLLLGGVIVSSIASSILMCLISLMVNRQLNSITWWMLGNLQGQNHLLVYISGAAALAGTALLWLFGRDANALSLGGEMAYSFGVNPERSARLLLFVASLLAASAVAVAGIIGFVGLVVPHILRRLVGSSDHRLLFPLALLTGGAFLVLCDLGARTVPTLIGVSSALEIPVGVVTSLVGGPFFLYLLWKGSRG